MKYLIILIVPFLFNANYMKKSELATLHTNPDLPRTTYTSPCEDCVKIDDIDLETHRLVDGALVEHADLVQAKADKEAAKLAEKQAKEAAKVLVKNAKGKIKNLSKEELNNIIEAMILILGL